ncbi:MAG: glycerol-3-phosphate acyltransferase [Planctomycetes bacterium]|nr:glycerol-3-phosphate acyltransferase [Planctomycetota bacterium]
MYGALPVADALDGVQLRVVLFFAAAAFVLGAVPFAWLVVRAGKGVDVRSVGSGNVGATNASRAFDGKGARLAAFLGIYLLDAGKGCLAVLLMQTASAHLAAAVIAAALAVLGHVFTPFLGWRGGKGVATATGALLALDWQVTLIAIGVFCVVRFATGHVFFGSLALGLALPLAAIALHPGTAFGERLPLTLLCLAIAAFLVWTHRSNLGRHFAARKAASS